MAANYNGTMVNSFPIEDNYHGIVLILEYDDEIILVSDKGQIIRVNVNQIRIAGRSTKGVSIFKIPETDRIVSVSRIQEIDKDE